MLRIEIPGGEFFNDDTQEFIRTKPQKLLLEHSLLSVSKWESKWKRPFFDKKQKTPEEYVDYIRDMTITSNVNPLAYDNLSVDNFRAIFAYIDDPHTATTITNHNKSRKSRGRIVTSELIYYWMFANGIPKECEKWHLNRLMTLIQIFSIENDPKGHKMSRSDIYQQNRELNEARRAKYHTSG